MHYECMLCKVVLYDVYPAHFRLLLHKDLVLVGSIWCELAAPLSFLTAPLCASAVRETIWDETITQDLPMDNVRVF